MVRMSCEVVISVRLGQQPFALAVLQFTQPLGFADIHAAVLGAPL